MSITRESIWAALPSTIKGTPLHLSYDPRTNRLVYPSNKAVILRSLSDPSSSTQFTGHTASTSVAKFAPSGYYIASGDVTGNVKVFDSSSTTEDPEIVKGTFPIISGRINDLTWDSDSKRIIAVGDGKERFGHCFTFDTGNSVGEITGHASQINAADIRSVRPFRAATAADDAAVVWLAGPPFKFVKAIRGEHTSFVTDLRFSLDGAYVVSVGMDRRIVIYDGKEGDVLARVDGAHDGGILSVASGKSEDGACRFATASTDGSVKLWEFKDSAVSEVFKWKVADDHLSGVVFTSTTTVTAVSLPGDIYTLSESSATPSETLYGHQKSITAVSVTSDLKSIYTASYDGRVVQWNAATGEAKLVSGSGHSGLITNIVETGGKFYTSAWDDTIKSFSAEEFTSSSLSTPAQPKSLTAAGEYLILATETAVYTYDLSMKQVASWSSSSITAVSANSSVAAVGSQSGAITLLSVPDLKPLPTAIAPLRAAVSTVSLCPLTDSDGRLLLAAGDTTGKIAVINVTDGSVVTTRWAFHTARVTSISWRADGKYVATGSLDTNVFVYSVDKPAKNVKTLGAHKDGVNAVAWVGEGKIVSVGADACVKLWNVAL
ncbi:actin cortical patch [Myxozyma melibiosi]|uniref:Actin cortical patch n=1 Tax=Myxozyma melibiosi TaxID=54550 RepID=A0ABR1F0D9_9ASCO